MAASIVDNSAILKAPKLDVDSLSINLDISPSNLGDPPNFRVSSQSKVPTLNVGISLSQVVNQASEPSLESTKSSTQSVGPLTDDWQPHTSSLVPTRDKSCRSSIPSITSLARRLSLKYSESYLGDVISIMRRLSIAGSSVRSSRGIGRSLRRESKNPTLLTVNELPAFDDGEAESEETNNREYPVTLPGLFSIYCWEEIKCGRLQSCHHETVSGSRWPNCRPRGHEADGSFPSHLFLKILDRTLERDSITSVDPFGNSVLHIATALASPLNYLLALLDLGANINALNNAGQTFYICFLMCRQWTIAICAIYYLGLEERVSTSANAIIMARLLSILLPGLGYFTGLCSLKSYMNCISPSSSSKQHVTI
jgi:hypothetical protein